MDPSGPRCQQPLLGGSHTSLSTASLLPLLLLTLLLLLLPATSGLSAKLASVEGQPLPKLKALLIMDPKRPVAARRMPQSYFKVTSVFDVYLHKLKGDLRYQENYLEVVEKLGTDTRDLLALVNLIRESETNDSRRVAVIYSPTLSPELVLVCNQLRLVCIGYGMQPSLPYGAELSREFRYVKIDEPQCYYVKSLLIYLQENRQIFQRVALVLSDCYLFVREFLVRHLLERQFHEFKPNSDRHRSYWTDDDLQLQHYFLFRVERAVSLANISGHLERETLPGGLIRNRAFLFGFVDMFAFNVLIDSPDGQRQLRYLTSSFSSHVFGPGEEPDDNEKDQSWYFSEQLQMILFRLEHVNFPVLSKYAINSSRNLARAFDALMAKESLGALGNSTSVRPAHCWDDPLACWEILQQHYHHTLEFFTCPESLCRPRLWEQLQKPTCFHDLEKLLNGVSLPDPNLNVNDLPRLVWRLAHDFRVHWNATSAYAAASTSSAANTWGRLSVEHRNLDLEILLNEEDPLIRVKEFSRDSANSDDFSWECKHGRLCYLIYRNGTQDPRPRCCFGIVIDFLFLSVEFPLMLQCEKMLSQESLSQQRTACKEMPNIISTPKLRVFAKDACRIGRRMHPVWPNISVAETNCMMEGLRSGRANMAIGSKVISSKDWRDEFLVTDPYLETSVSIVVNKTEKLSGRATRLGFLYPFDATTWLCIFSTVQLAAVAAAIYEWMSPFGQTPRGRNRDRVFGFPSALTLTWSVLFSHTVQTKSPKCWSSRFLLNVYAIFCLVFIASYTANLAAFMVDDSESSDIVGIQDARIQRGEILLGTVTGSGTEVELNRTHPNLFKFMKFFTTADEAMVALSRGEIGAFLYETELLQYLLKTNQAKSIEVVGKPFGRVGYIAAISPLLLKPGRDLAATLTNLLSTNDFTDQMRQKIDLWSKIVPGKEARSQGKKIRLTPTNFAGPLLLFCCGVLLGLVTMCCEQVFYYLAFPLIRRSPLPPGCCLPISQRVYRHLVLYRKMEAERISKQTHLPVALRLQKYSSNRDSLLLSGDAISTFATTTAAAAAGSSYIAANAEPESVMSGLSGLTYSNRMLLNNIAVQTDVDDCISSQLEDVDDEIRRRSDQFQRDMRGMRERVAQLLHDREVLVRRLAAIEGKSRAAVEEELQQQLADAAGSVQQQQQQQGATSGRRINIELTHNNLLTRAEKQKKLPTKAVLL